MRADPIIDFTLFGPATLAILLDLHAQLTTGSGTGASMSRAVRTADLVFGWTYTLSFDVEVLTPTKRI